MWGFWLGRSAAVGARICGTFIPEKSHQSLAVSSYFLEGLSSAEEAETIARRLLCDPVIERFEVLSDSPNPPKNKGGQLFEISHRAGVTDAVAETLMKRSRTLVGIELDPLCDCDSV